MDNKDQQSYHLRGTVGKKLIAYLRILPPGLAYEQSSLGRVVCSATYRKKGAGIALMQKGIKENSSLFGNQPIVIGAQLYLQRFYENLGFEQCSESYMEDDIPHIKMVKNE